MADCQWIATLHAHGLLSGGFVPTAQVRAYFGDRDRSFRLKVTGHFGAS
jgi:hypothetical protein